MDIAIVTPRFPPTFAGGGEKSVELLATHLAESERVNDVTVFSFDGTEETTVNGVQVRRLGSVSSFITEHQNLVALPRLRSRLAEYDIVHAYNMELHPAVGYLAKNDHVNSVATLNSYHFFPKSLSNTEPGRLERVYELVGHPTTGRILVHYAKQNDRFIALSHTVKNIYEEQGFDGSKIDVVPNMIDPTFEVPPREVSTDRCRLLYVGSLTPNKGVEYLVRTMALLPPDEYQLRIVGSGEQEQELRALASKCEVMDRITFCGSVPYEQVSHEYANADIFVHPGVWPEPFGRTILEALQAGLKVVCTDIGAPPEIVPDDDLICEPENPKMLAQTIRRANECTNHNTDYCRYLCENYSPKQVISKVTRAYERVQNKHK